MLIYSNTETIRHILIVYLGSCLQCVLPCLAVELLPFWLYVHSCVYVHIAVIAVIHESESYEVLYSVSICCCVSHICVFEVKSDLKLCDAIFWIHK